MGRERDREQGVRERISSQASFFLRQQRCFAALCVACAVPFPFLAPCLLPLAPAAAPSPAHSHRPPFSPRMAISEPVALFAQPVLYGHAHVLEEQCRRRGLRAPPALALLLAEGEPCGRGWHQEAADAARPRVRCACLHRVHVAAAATADEHLAAVQDVRVAVPHRQAGRVAAAACRAAKGASARAHGCCSRSQGYRWSVIEQVPAAASCCLCDDLTWLGRGVLHGGSLRQPALQFRVAERVDHSSRHVMNPGTPSCWCPHQQAPR